MDAVEGVLEQRRVGGGGGARGDTITLFGAANGMTEKKKYEIHVVLKWLLIDDNTHNNQPKTGSRNGWEYGGKV